MSTPDTEWEKEFEYLIRELHFALQGYEVAKQMGKEYDARSLEEKITTYIGSLTANDVIRHEQNITDAHLKIKSFITNLLTSRDTYWKERVRKEVESKDGAYHERNVLVCALTKLFPAYLARHNEDDKTWERDWMWIVYIDLPTGQVSWHIHDSEREMFNHLEVKENNWDGHNTERKYQRLQALDTLLDNLK